MKTITIPSESGPLEGVFKGAKKRCGAIITHPHPEYGGNMHNGVVLALEKAYQDKGYATLRFNFRGTGNSCGEYDTWHDLCDDVIAAHHFLCDQDILEIALAGYSFGSWVNAHADPNLQGLTHQLLVSPPVSFMDFSKIKGFSCDSFVVCGDRDEYAAFPEVKKCLEIWDATSFKIIKGCDHFYSGRVGQLHTALENTI